MEGHGVVRRKDCPPAKTTTNRWDTADVSSFYVNNLPRDTFKKELWAPCAALGNLVDIYIAGRKDASGSFFAFVRYQNPADADSIVYGLNDVTCSGRKLSANIAKHGRTLPQKPQKKPVTNPIPIVNMTTRGTRSFAEVAGGKMQPSPAIVVKEEVEIEKWLDKSILVRRAKNFDILCNFPSLFELEGFEVAEAKYGGGINILLKFITGRAAEIFKANKVLWLKWFSNMEFFGASNGPFVRIAWIKITGIPLTAWDEENLVAITVFPDSDSEEEEADMEEDDDGISDTFDQNYMDDEEGEFRPDDGFGAMENGKFGGKNELPENHLGELPLSHAEEGACSTYFNGGAKRDMEAPLPIGAQLLIHDPITRQPNTQATGPFGPGSAHRTPPSGPASSPEFELGDSAMKRRRTKIKSKITIRFHKRLSQSRSPLRSLDLNQQASSASSQPLHGNDGNNTSQKTAQSTSEIFILRIGSHHRTRKSGGLPV
ncbi:hypothetical protein LXL04_007890 [Taraxacum kok-saghyz]